MNQFTKPEGFQPFQVSWGPYWVDAIFCSGMFHCNHGTDLMKATGRLIHAILGSYRDVPIIVVYDRGFMDDRNFRFLKERLKTHFFFGENNMLMSMTMSKVFRPKCSAALVTSRKTDNMWESAIA